MSDPQVIPFNKAMLCADCDAITNGTHECLACGGKGIFPIHRLLNAEPTAEVAALQRMTAAR